MKWFETGLDEVEAEVFRLPLPLPEYLPAVNAYILRSGRTATLVDPGWDSPETYDLLGEALARLGLDWSRIDRTVVTHLHRDHLGAAVRLRQRHDVPIVMGAAERPGLQWAVDVGWNTPAPQIAQMRRFGAEAIAEKLAAEGPDPSIETDAWRPADIWVADEEIVASGDRSLVALHTPGHTAGHIVLRDSEDRFLLTGDHLLPDITPSVGFDALPASSPLVDFLTSLARVGSLPSMPFLPAHGAPHDDQRERVDELLAHHRARLATMVRRLSGEPRSAADVAAEIGWTRRERQFHELELFNQMLAVIETDAHLAWGVSLRLVAEEQGPDAVVRYRLLGEKESCDDR